MPESDLERLAAAGRAAADRSAHAEAGAAEELSAEEATERRVRALEAASNWSAMGAGYLYFRILGLFGAWIPFFFGGLLVSVCVPESTRRTLEPIAPLYFGGTFGALALIWIASVPLARAGLRRELIWGQSQPFALPNHAALLESRRLQSDLRVRFEFAGEAPEESLLRDLLSIDGAVWKVSNPIRGGLVAERGWSTNADDNRAVVRWLHRAVERSLRTLHAQYPIASITIDCRD